MVHFLVLDWLLNCQRSLISSNLFFIGSNVKYLANISWDCTHRFEKLLRISGKIFFASHAKLISSNFFFLNKCALK